MTPYLELKKFSGHILADLLLPAPLRDGWSHKMLVIKDDSIGDFLLFTGVFNEIKKIFSDKQIFLLVNSIVAGIAPLYNDNIIVIDRHRYYRALRYRLAVLKEIRRTGFRTVIGSVLRSSECNDITRFSSAEIRWGYEKEVSSLRGVDSRRFKIYKRQVPSLDRFLQNDGRFNHVLSHERHFLEHITGKRPGDCDPFIPFENKKEDKIMRTTGLEDREYFVILPGSNNSSRNYPLEGFFSVAEALYHETGLLPVFLGGTRESDAKIKVNGLRYPFVDLISALSLSSSIHVLRNARLTIGNETGLTHASWIAGVPTVMVMGGGHYGRFLPLRENGRAVFNRMDCFLCNWKCKYPEIPYRCITSISEKKLLDVAFSLLSSYKGRDDKRGS